MEYSPLGILEAFKAFEEKHNLPVNYCTSYPGVTLCILQRDEVDKETSGIPDRNLVHLNAIHIDGRKNFMDVVIQNNGGFMRKTFNKICNYLVYGRSFKRLSDKWLD